MEDKEKPVNARSLLLKSYCGGVQNLIIVNYRLITILYFISTIFSLYASILLAISTFLLTDLIMKHRDTSTPDFGPLPATLSFNEQTPVASSPGRAGVRTEA